MKIQTEIKAGPYYLKLEGVTGDVTDKYQRILRAHVESREPITATRHYHREGGEERFFSAAKNDSHA